MDDSTILQTLARVRFRLTAARAVETGLRAAAATVLILAAGAAAYSFLPAWYRAFAYPFAPLLLIPAAFLCGAALRLARPVTLREAAIYLDRQAGLLERVATAYELLCRQDRDSGLGQLVCDEARQICCDFRPADIRYSRSAAPLARYLAAAILVCTAALFLPPYKTDAFLRDQNRQAGALAAAGELSLLAAAPAANSQADPQIAVLLNQAEQAVETLRNHPEAAASAKAELEHVKNELEKLKNQREATAKSAGGQTPPDANSKTTNTPTVPGAAPDSGNSTAIHAVPGQSSPAAGSTTDTKLAAAIDVLNRTLQQLSPPGPPAAGSNASPGAAAYSAAPARSDSAAGPWATIYQSRSAALPFPATAGHGPSAGPPPLVTELPGGPPASSRHLDDPRLPDDLRDLARKYFSGDQP